VRHQEWISDWNLGEAHDATTNPGQPTGGGSYEGAALPFTLEISDDGRGITEAATTGPGSLGILGMRERAAALGGVLEVAPRSGGGTRVTAWFPPLPGTTGGGDR